MISEEEMFGLFARVEEKHWWFKGRRTILRALVNELLPPLMGHMIVDVGCGSGGTVASLSQEYMCRGIDISKEAIRLSRKRFNTVDYTCGDAARILSEPNAPKTDLIVLMDVMEHVEDDIGFLAELVEVLEPGAFVVLTVPADMSLWSSNDEDQGHFRRYELDDLSKVWAGLPVTPLMLSYFNSRLYFAIKFARVVSRIRGKAWGDSGLDMGDPPILTNSLFTWLFEGEVGRLLDALHGGQGFSRGVSIVGVLRKDG